MSTPRYFRIYDIPECDAHYGADPGFTRRCDSVATELYKLIASAVKLLHQIPGECLDDRTWDLCYCAGVLVDSIPFDGWTVETSCEREAPQLFKLARRFIEYKVSGQTVRTNLEALTRYVTHSEGAAILEAAS